VQQEIDRMADLDPAHTHGPPQKIVPPHIAPRSRSLPTARGP
jgi:hypothetical protein